MYKQIECIMNANNLLVIPNVIEMNNITGYVTGAVIAILILGYLIYSLINPEKF